MTEEVNKKKMPKLKTSTLFFIMILLLILVPVIVVLIILVSPAILIGYVFKEFFDFLKIRNKQKLDFKIKINKNAEPNFFKRYSKD